MRGANSKVFVSIILTLLIVGMLRSGFFVQPVKAEGLLALTGTETRITTDLANQEDPAISGNIIVYTDSRGLDLDIWYYDLATHLESRATPSVGDQQLTDISEGIIVFQDSTSGDVWAYSTLTKVATDISKSGQAYEPAIGQGLVAWQDRSNGNSEIYAMNLTTGEERRITNSLERDNLPAVNDGVIVWQRTSLTQSDVYSYDWKSNTIRQITNTPTVNEGNPDIYGKNVVYERWTTAGDHDIYTFNLTSGIERQVPFPHINGCYPRNPNISGDFVSFENASSSQAHMMLWNIATNQVYQIPHGTSFQFLNDIDGNNIVYTDNRNGQFDIYMFTFIANYSLTILNPVGGTTNPPTGTHSYELGSNVSISATPDISHRFDHWELDGSNAGSSNPISLTMNANHTLLAIFTQITPPTVGGISLPTDWLSSLSSYIGIIAAISLVLTSINYAKHVAHKKSEQ